MILIWFNKIYKLTHIYLNHEYAKVFLSEQDSFWSFSFAKKNKNFNHTLNVCHVVILPFSFISTTNARNCKETCMSMTKRSATRPFTFHPDSPCYFKSKLFKSPWHSPLQFPKQECRMTRIITIHLFQCILIRQPPAGPHPHLHHPQLNCRDLAPGRSNRSCLLTWLLYDAKSHIHHPMKSHKRGYSHLRELAGYKSTLFANRDRNLEIFTICGA